jgi:hypothetical protein
LALQQQHRLVLNCDIYPRRREALIDIVDQDFIWSG